MDRQTGGFFLLAFAWTWSWQAPVMLGVQGPAAIALLGLAGLGPSLAAILVTRGRLVRALRWRVSAVWALVAVALPLAPRIASRGIDAVLGQPLPPELWAAPAMLGMVVLPPLGEELGWRGLAYPRLADRIGRVRAAVLTGVVWAVWHVPISLARGSDLSSLLVYVVLVTAGGVWMAWLFERSGRSVTVAILAHATINAGLIARGSDVTYLLVSIAIAVAAAADLGRDRGVATERPAG